MTSDPPKYSILGLGDIVIPGIFVSLCLRFDFLKTLDLDKLKLFKEKSAQNSKKELLGFLNFKAKSASKHYFTAVLVGYLVAILATIVVMLVFEHGQPALLYLVPGTIIAVLATAFSKGEFNLMWNFNEEHYVLKEESDKDK